MIRLTKLDAAQSQLRTAIRLFFEEHDPVSIRTLASAAQEVFRGLIKARGIPSPSIKDTDRIPDDKRGLWIKAVNRESTFFKHADTDPDAVLDFDPDFVQFIILDGCLMCSKLTDGKIPRECTVFGHWFILKNPQFLKDDNPLRTQIIRFPQAEILAHSNRKVFLAWLDIDDLWQGPKA